MSMSMQLLRENAGAWIALALNAATLCVFIATAVLGAWGLHREKRGAQASELSKIARTRSVLEQILRGSMYGLVTQAEQTYGPGMGEVKKSAVLVELLRLLPEQWRDLFDAQTLSALIENGLAAAKEAWTRGKQAAER